LWNQAASLASVTALAGSKVTSIDRSVGRTGKLSFSVVVGAQFFESKQLIVADGSNSATSKILGIPTVRTGPTRMGASAHFSGKFEVQPRYVKIFINRGCEFYVTPLSDGRLNLAVLARFDGDVDIAAVLQDLRLQRRIFSSMGFSGQIEAPPIGRSPLGNAHRSGLSAGVFLVGDAAEEFDPIGGMGMTHALLSAELAASHILATSTDQIQEIAANVVDYEQKRHAAAKVFRVFTRVSYSALRSAHLFPPMLDIATSRVGLALSAMLAPH
jgi:2-polyprenyl-6-methoxyphenol hydroxylase-like FAD-dependent oxidoreductase